MSARLTLAAATAVAWVFTATAASGQAAAPTQEALEHQENLKRFALPEVQLDKVGSGTLGRVQSALNGIELTAGAKGSAATVKLSRKVGDVNGLRLVSLTATAPFDEDKDDGGFSLDSFTSGSSLKFEFTSSGLRGEKLGEFKETMDLCAAVARAKGIKDDYECDSQFIEENAPDRLDEFDRLKFTRTAHAFTFAAFAKVGHKEFKYLDLASFSEKSETETPWSLGASYSIVPLWRRQLYMVKFEHQKGYGDQDERTICPAPTGAPVACLTGPLGPPKHDDKDLLTGEFRQRFSKSLALALTATYDVGSEAFGVAAPVYFIAGEGYAGGVEVKYTRDGKSTKRDKDELTIGVFVRKELTLF